MAIAATVSDNAEWIALGPIDGIPRRGARVVLVGDERIALFRTAEDTIHAVSDRCPHSGGPLSDGIVHGDSVTCPLHGWRIQLATGSAEAPDVGCVDRYATLIDDGEIYLCLTAEPR